MGSRNWVGNLILSAIIGYNLATIGFCIWLLIYGNWFLALIIGGFVFLTNLDGLHRVNQLSEPHIKLGKRCKQEFIEGFYPIKYRRVKLSKWNLYDQRTRIYVDDNIEIPNAEIIVIGKYRVHSHETSYMMIYFRGHYYWASPSSESRP